MTTENCFLEETHSSWMQPAIAEAAWGLRALALQLPALPSAFKGFPSLSLLLFQFSRSDWQPANRGLAALSQHLPPWLKSPFRLPLTFPRALATASRTPQLCCRDTDTQTQGVSLPWARQETLPNTSEHSAVRN